MRFRAISPFGLGRFPQPISHTAWFGTPQMRRNGSRALCPVRWPRHHRCARELKRRLFASEGAESCPRTRRRRQPPLGWDGPDDLEAAGPSRLFGASLLQHDRDDHDKSLTGRFHRRVMINGPDLPGQSVPAELEVEGSPVLRVPGHGKAAPAEFPDIPALRACCVCLRPWNPVRPVTGRRVIALLEEVSVQRHRDRRRDRCDLSRRASGATFERDDSPDLG